MNLAAIWLGKLVGAALRLVGRRGNALPGLIVERVFPGFLPAAFARLPLGVVVVSGTNGKTTTTKMLATVLSREYRVLTNDTGSNFVRGAITATCEHAHWRGRLDADVAVLELDEAHAVRFVEIIAPQRVLLLNVMRDQLDRFGEIDTTADLLRAVARTATQAVVLNRDDPRICAIAQQVGASVSYYGVAANLRVDFPTDDELYGAPESVVVDAASSATAPVPAPERKLDEAHPDARRQALSRGGAELLALPAGSAELTDLPPASAELTDLPPGSAEFTDLPPASAELLAMDLGETSQIRVRIGTAVFDIDLRAGGAHNAQNAVGAAAMALTFGMSADVVAEGLRAVEPAFGRGQTFTVQGRRLVLHLVKNPAGFRQTLRTLAAYDAAAIVIAINDDYADSRDVSWLWDVDFTAALGADITPRPWLLTSGTRAADMALRLRYDDIAADEVEQDLRGGVLRAVEQVPMGATVIVLSTYTAMWALHSILLQIGQAVTAAPASAAPAKPPAAAQELAEAQRSNVVSARNRASGQAP